MTDEGAQYTVTWRQLAPIFADIMVSPTNLLTGGLLISFLPTWQALISIVIGYIILAFVFILYGGLGYKKRMQSAEIFRDLFGPTFGAYIVPLILAAGQIGWSAFNVGLGGTALAMIAHVPVWAGISIYAVLLATMAILDLNRLAIVKTTVIASTAVLLVYAVVAKLFTVSMFDFLVYQPSATHSIMWGISIMVASYVSIATVSPDFFQFAARSRDVVLASLVGMVLPGFVMTLTGCFLFFNQQGYDLNRLLLSLTFPLFPMMLNMIANTDGSIPFYTAALKFISIRPLRLAYAVAISGTASAALALLHITDYLPLWLNILSIMAPVFIGVAFAAVLFEEVSPAPVRQWVRNATLNVYTLTLMTCIIVAFVMPSVLFALVLPLILFGMYVQYRLM